MDSLCKDVAIEEGHGRSRRSFISEFLEHVSAKVFIEPFFGGREHHLWTQEHLLVFLRGDTNVIP